MQCIFREFNLCRIEQQHSSQISFYWKGLRLYEHFLQDICYIILTATFLRTCSMAFVERFNHLLLIKKNMQLTCLVRFFELPIRNIPKVRRPKMGK